MSDWAPTCLCMKTTEPSSRHVPPCRSTWSMRSIWQQNSVHSTQDMTSEPSSHHVHPCRSTWSMRTAQYLTQHNTVVYNTVHSTQDMTSEPSSRHVPPPCRSTWSMRSIWHNKTVYNLLRIWRESRAAAMFTPFGPHGACAVSDTTQQCTIYSGYDDN